MKIVILSCLALLPLTAIAQTTPDPITTQSIEKVLSELNDPNKPGSAIAIVRDGKLVYQKAFGSSDLEHKIPTTVDTQFQANIFAGEFIAFATLHLEEQGKLSLEDDIRKYLPESPDYGKTIRIRHLLSATDGLQSYQVLKSLAGWESREADNIDALLRLISNQKKLNFKPGENFSNGADTRLLILMKVVEKVSGMSFDAYVKSQLFAPLGMHNTVFQTENSAPVSQLALPYRQQGSDGKGAYKLDFDRATGPFILYTSIRDLSTWKLNQSSHKLGSKSLVDKLYAPIRLDNGKTLRRSGGIANFTGQLPSLERGMPKTYLVGSSGGYGSSIWNFPEHKFTAIVLSSGLAYNGSYGMRVSYSQLEKHFPEPETIDYTKVARVKLSPVEMSAYAGNFWSPELTFPAKIFMKNDNLYYHRLGAPLERALIPLGDSVFQMQIEGDDVHLLKFVDKPSGKDIHYTIGKSDPVVLESYQTAKYNNSELAQFTGVFYSKELNTSYVFEVIDGTLIAQNLATGTSTFTPIHPDRFSGNKRFLGGIKFTRDNKEGVTGFQVEVDGARNLQFKKMRVASEKSPL